MTLIDIIIERIVEAVGPGKFINHLSTADLVHELAQNVDQDVHFSIALAETGPYNSSQ